MFKHLLFTATIVFCLQSTLFSQNIIYVKQGAKGNGSSWANATGNLQVALTKAKPGTKIWIAEGTYYPTSCTSCTEDDRSISFLIPEGVEIYGGFDGNEKRLRQRDHRKNLTQLSGNIGRPDPYDNSYTVVMTQSVSHATILDGLIIADGQADANKPVRHPFRSGGGLFNDGSGIGNLSNPTLRNCLFLNNFAIEGGAIYNDGSYGNASPDIQDCTFTSNRAIYGGGAMYNNSEHGISTPNITYTQFVSNEAAFGSGIFNSCTEEDTDPKIFNCTFVNNKTQHGGSLFFLGLSEVPKLRTVSFVNNISDNDEDISVMKAMVVPRGLMAEMPLDDEGY